MIIAVIFILAALFGAVRTICFAVFTAGDKNYAGAVMLFILSAFVLTSAFFTCFKL